jgi:4-amino-4-deoxy-L-arabinose transferase-like glycosyltransferase
MRIPRLKFRQPDLAIAALIGVAYVALLLSGAAELGYARDEGFYFQAARSYEAWFELLLTSPQAALDPSLIDRYWGVNHEHPSLMKSLFALSHHYLWGVWHVFREQGTAYRFPGMLVSALGVAVTYLWGQRELGRLAGIVAALSLAFMPRVFYHSHLACFDMPVATMWLVTMYAYQRSLRSGPGWAIATGVLYGLLLDTKHNSWLLPGALILHLLVTRRGQLWRELRTGRIRLPLAFYALIVLSPLVFYASWPWIWHDTGRRLAEYAAFHMGHEYYNMEFLGRTYWKPPMPRLYAWVMTLATVPGITLLLFGVGIAASSARLVPRWRVHMDGESVAHSDQERRFSNDALWALSLLFAYAPWLSPTTPIFGGTKHWITAYPFLCLFAGRGFSLLTREFGELVSAAGRATRWVPLGLGLCVLIGPVVMTLHAHPWGLSFYTPLVGGAPGAASLGLNRTFWGYTTGSVQGFINARAAPNAQIYVHDTALQSWDMLHLDGRVRTDLHGTLAIPASNLALYQHEPHMSRVEYEIWADYATAAPAAIGAYDGVPVVWVYERPRR